MDVLHFVVKMPKGLKTDVVCKKMYKVEKKKGRKINEQKSVQISSATWFVFAKILLC